MRAIGRGGFLSAIVVSSAIVMTSFVSSRAEAQVLAQRISAVHQGKVRFSYAARSGLCGYNNSISRGQNNRVRWSPEANPDVEYDQECSHGPVRLVLNVDGGRVSRITTYVGGNWRPATSGVVDLGTVSAKDAEDYLINLSSIDAESVGRNAIMPATLADSVVLWPPLSRLARDEKRPTATRKEALFWLGQAAAERITENRPSFAISDDATEVKKAAVFALSQRRNEDAVAALIAVARNNRDPEVRKSALFWLGQTSDSRAISLFEEILNAH